MTLADPCERDTPKGRFYFLDVAKKGRATALVLAELLPEVLARSPGRSRSRWGDRPERWVRPLESILCLFAGSVVPFAFAGREAGNASKGHRFLAPAVFAVADFADYAAKLKAAKVILDPAERRALIADQADRLAAAKGLSVLADPGLLAEVAGLVEWPLVLMGGIDDAFMSVPREVLSTSMRSHQKYFSLVDAKGDLAPHFLVVSNMQPADGGARIVAGNERVLRARLSDARFFWDTDREHRLDSRVAALKDRIFHAALGSVLDKAGRIEALSRRIAAALDADEAKAARAARSPRPTCPPRWSANSPNCRGDGPYYALHDGETAAVARAVAEHYAPQGPERRLSDRAAVGGGSRSPTRSTVWSASSPSTKSPPARAIPLPCAAQPWGASGWFWTTACASPCVRCSPPPTTCTRRRGFRTCVRATRWSRS